MSKNPNLISNGLLGDRETIYVKLVNNSKSWICGFFFFAQSVVVGNYRIIFLLFHKNQLNILYLYC